MRDATVSRSYAEALFELGEKHAQHEAFAAGMQTIDALLAADPRVRLFLQTPKIEPGLKKQALQQALGASLHPLLLKFLFVVVDKRRQRLLDAIAAEYRTLLDEKLGRLSVELTLAHRPDEAQLRAIGAQLSRVLEREVTPNVRVDEDILGGIIVRYRDRVIDGSLRRRLVAMRSRLLHTTIQKSA
jgi:F-type H+-transporting ATPase subunit delta